MESESDLSGLVEDSELIYINNFDFSKEESLKSIAFLKNLKKMDFETANLDFTRLRRLFSVENAVSKLIV